MAIGSVSLLTAGDLLCTVFLQCWAPFRVTKVASVLRAEDSSIGPHGTAKLSWYVQYFRHRAQERMSQQWRKTVAKPVGHSEL